MKSTKLFLLVVLFFTSCAPPAISAPTPTQTFTPEPTATQTPSPTPTIIPTPTQIGGGAGKLIFEYYKVAYEKAFPQLKGDINVFISNTDGTDLIPITNGLNNINLIESVSSNGQMVLVSSRSDYYSKGNLYLIHLNSFDSTPIKLASGLISFLKQAIFLDDSHIAYLGQGLDGFGLYTINIDGTNPKKIGNPTGKYWTIRSSDKTHIYWDSIQNENFKDSTGFLYEYGDFNTLWWTNIDGSAQGKLESNGQQIISSHYAFSNDGTSIAWIPEQTEPGCSFNPLIDSKGNQITTMDQTEYYALARKCYILHVASLTNLNSDTRIPLIQYPPSNLLDENQQFLLLHKEYDLIWRPDNSEIFAYDQGNPNIYFGKDYQITIYDVPLKDADPKLTRLKLLANSSVSQPGTGALPNLTDGFTGFNFSSDGRQLLFSGYDQVNGNFYYSAWQSIIYILDLETMNYANSFGQNITPDLKLLRVGNIYWLP